LPFRCLKDKLPMRLVIAPIAAAAFLSTVLPQNALAYVGNSYLQIPEMDGSWRGEPYKKWIKFDAHYWQGRQPGMAGLGRRTTAFISGPTAPRQGAGTLVFALDKRDADLQRLMERCVAKAPIPEATYAESSERARSSFEIGPRPATFPEYFEYRLKDVLISECPIVEDAPEQAFILTFKNIEWLNYGRDGSDNKNNMAEIQLQPAPLKPATATGKSKTFVLTWFAAAHDVEESQCATLNAKPLESDYYALMSKEDADKERAELAGKGGVNYENGQMGMRGPRKLNVTMLPGIVKDPGHAIPKNNVARGLNLDGDDGKGSPPPGICKHKNYVSEDGRSGIDNQLYTVQGCIQGFQGHKGFVLQFANNQMRDGQMSILVTISGIDSEQNDDNVDVTVAYSLDPMAKSASGSEVLSDYTFRVTDKPEYTHFFSRVRAKIVKGVVTTERMKSFHLNLGVFGTPRALELADAQMRLVLQPDGTLKGVVGGYRDWRKISSTYATSTTEMYHGFQQPAMYNAFKRAADGLKDPITGECNGISSAYDMEGIPAFLPTKRDELVTQSDTQKARPEK